MATDEPVGQAAVDPSGPPPPPPPPPPSPSPAPPPFTQLNLADPALNDDLAAVASRLDEGKREAATQGAPIAEERPYNADIEVRNYNADESRDTTRQTITLWLIGLLCAIVTLTFVALFARGASVGFASTPFFDDLKKILDVLVGPVITLLASAVGFYFGSKQGESVAPPKSKPRP